MRALILAALLCAGCSSSTPVAPSTSTAPPPAPVAPPAPVFPTLAGSWTGTHVQILAAVTPNYSLTVVCDATWNVFTQNQGSFTGDLLISGTHDGATCSGGVRLSGSVTVGGVITIDQAWPFNDAACSLKSTENLHGTVSGRAIKITQTDSWSCPPYLINRNILVEVSR